VLLSMGGFLSPMVIHSIQANQPLHHPAKSHWWEGVVNRLCLTTMYAHTCAMRPVRGFE